MDACAVHTHAHAQNTYFKIYIYIRLTERRGTLDVYQFAFSVYFINIINLKYII